MDVVIVLLVLVIVALSGAIFYLYRRNPKARLSPQETYMEALKALLNNDRSTAFLRLKETVMADTNNVDAYLRLAGLLRQRGNVKKSLQIDSDLNMRQNLTHYEHGEVLQALAEDYMALAQFDAAEKILNQLKDFPDRKHIALKKLVSLYSRKKDWRKAFQHQSELLKLQYIDDKSSLADLRFKHGVELMEQGQYHDARMEFKDALKYNPKLVEAVVAIGDSYDKEDKLVDAVKAWKQIIDVDPSRADIVFGRIQKVLFDLGQFSEMEDLYNQVLEKDVKNLHAILGLASLAEKRGESGLAEEYYNQALDIKSDYLPALLGLIRLYQNQQRTEDAARVINRTAEAFLHH